MTTAVSGQPITSAGWNAIVNDVNYLSGQVTAAYDGKIGTINVQKFTSAGTFTYTPSANLLYAVVEVWGGGGSGASGITGQPAGAGGGGGYARKVLTAAAIGASQTVTIAAASTAIAANINVGGNPGGTCSFGSLVSATGGGGCHIDNSSAPGGIGSGGDLNLQGGFGIEIEGPYWSQGGAGAAGGAGGTINGAAAGQPGGGGGGGYNTQPSVAGALGMVLVTEFCK